MKTIGRYTIRGMLGRGGMGRVFKVEIPVLGKIAALKLLDPDPLLAKLLGFETLHRMFTREAITIARLQHPNLVSIFDYQSGPGPTFYLMDYYADNLGVLIGETYQVEQPSRRIGVDKTLHYCRQILEGLICLHEAGIIHRDIKPYNVLITARDTVKICDFGLSKLRGESYAGPPNLNVGSPFYAAPEQHMAPNDVDPTADLYALGVILYRMLTGQLPEDEPVLPSRLYSDLDTQWDRFILKAMAPRPRDRFCDALAMLDDLDRLADHWQDQRTRACTLPGVKEPLIQSATPDVKKTTPVRSQPLKLSVGEAARRFGLDNLWRPVVYPGHDFTAIANDCILDRARGLVWQQGGSHNPMPWDQAHAYVDKLNQDHAGGQSCWRLPTAEELMTLLRPMPEDRELCIAPIFADRQQRLWSCDRKSFTAAYCVDVKLGFVGWQELSAPCYVRAVCAEICAAI